MIPWNHVSTPDTQWICISSFLAVVRCMFVGFRNHRVIVTRVALCAVDPFLLPWFDNQIEMLITLRVEEEEECLLEL